MTSVEGISAARIESDWRTLCGRIGERRAGTAAEHAAAGFIADRFRAAGIADVTQETFPCTSLRAAEVEVAAQVGRRWERCEAAALVGAPSTPAGAAVEGEVTWLEMPENTGRLRRGSLRGRIAAVFGPLPTEVDQHRRLVAASPAAVIHIDERLPFAWTKNDGVYPRWATRYGMPPTVTIPYMTAWRWRQRGVSHVRVRSRVNQVAAESVNVIARLPGAAASAEELVISAHHDTQNGNPGADDNGSGVMCLLELARVLAPLPRQHAVRFISFGTEEQLSVGSAEYVRTHRRELRRVRLVVNFDSVSSVLGHVVLSCIGTDALARAAVDALAARGLDVQLERQVTPFVDNFPFNCAGVPSLWFTRRNCSGGRWQHHSRHDTLDNVSVPEVVRLLQALLPWMTRLLQSSAWPFPRRVPAAQQRAADRLGRELFGFSS